MTTLFQKPFFCVAIRFIKIIILSSFGKVKQILKCSFKAYLLTECAYSGFEPQGGERWSAELDGCTSEPISVVLFIGERVA